MASITVRITIPQLVAGQSFSVRYREMPAGAYSAPQTEDNDPFTVTGLNAGSQYEFEITLVNADETTCPPIYWYDTAKEFICADFDIEQEGDGINTPYRLAISYTLPMGYAAPCKWYVRVKQTSSSSGWQVANYPVLPTSPFYVPLPTLPVQDYDVQIYADQCDGTFKYCFDDTVPAPEPEPCVPLVVNSTSIQLSDLNNGYPKVAIQINTTNSTPIATNTTIYANQRNLNIVPPNLPRSYTGNFNPAIPSGNNGFGMILSPTKTQIYIVDVHFTDACGVVHNFTVTLDLS